MAGLLGGDPSMYEGTPYNRQPEDGSGGRWYYSRKEIEENSRSMLDGIDLKKETYLRKSYCTFLQDLGMRLKVPQVTIATAIIFCHRFFLRQSHTKNDRRTIATVCMFLAGKVEETPRPLKDVILVSYEIIHKKDPAAAQRIKQKEVYEQQKELILLGERVVLATLGFDLNVNHPYKPLVEAIKKFKVAQNALAQVAWNFVNDGLRTSLCLQFKPHHIAAGAIFLAAKFLKVKLPSEGEKVWWQEFDVTPRQLEEVSNQMLELYEQNRVPPSQTSEVEGSAGGGVTPRAPTKGPFATEEHIPNKSNSQGGDATSKPGTLKLNSSRPTPDQSYLDIPAVPSRPTQNQSNDYESSDVNSIPDYKRDGEINDSQRYVSESLPNEGNMDEVQSNSKYGSEGYGEVDREKNTLRSCIKELGDSNDKYQGQNLDYKDSTLGQSPQDAIKKIDKDKVKAALEKRKKARGATARKMDLTDDDDLIERVLEDGIELAAENEKIKWEKKQTWSKPSSRSDLDHGHQVKRENADEDGHLSAKKWQSASGQDYDNVEEGELATLDDSDRGYRSPKTSNCKIKAGSPPEKPVEGKQRQDYIRVAHHHNHHDFKEDKDGGMKLLYSERDHKRHVQENHV